MKGHMRTTIDLYMELKHRIEKLEEEVKELREKAGIRDKIIDINRKNK
jgi:hypothetical protein